jgi:hypothetical protein
VQHRAALGRVDRPAGEHRRAALLDAAFMRQVEQEVQRRGVDQVLRQVGEHFGRLDAECGEAVRVACKRFAQVEVAAMRLEVAAQCGPGFGAIAAHSVLGDAHFSSPWCRSGTLDA